MLVDNVSLLILFVICCLWNITSAIICKKHVVENQNVYVCKPLEKQVEILPLFTINSLDGKLYKNTRLDKMVRKLTVQLSSDIIRDKIANLHEYRDSIVNFTKIETVKFRDLDKVLLTTIKPCYIFSDEWISLDSMTDTHNTDVSLTLIANKFDNDCFYQLDVTEVQDTIQVSYVTSDNTIHHSKLQILSGISNSEPPTSIIVRSLISIQCRAGGALSFQKSWVEYENGFGTLHGSYCSGTTNRWIGLKKLHELTKTGMYKLRLEMRKFGADTVCNSGWCVYWTEYDEFRVGPQSDKYRLTIGGYNPSSTAGDSMTNPSFGSHHQLNKMQFSTKDNDNDLHINNCAGSGGWWFNSCHSCQPNGIWSDTKVQGGQYIFWFSLDRYNALAYFRMYLLAK